MQKYRYKGDTYDSMEYKGLGISLTYFKFLDGNVPFYEKENTVRQNYKLRFVYNIENDTIMHNTISEIGALIIVEDLGLRKHRRINNEVQLQFKGE